MPTTTVKVTTTPASTTTREVIESTTTVTEKPEPTTTTPGKICSEPMDLEDIFGIPTTVVPRFTASSNEPKGDVGRIDSTEPWTPSEVDLVDQDAWIKIEFDEPVYIYGLVVRGGGSESGKFVTKIKIDYQLSEGDDYTPVTPSEEEEHFPANSDDNTPSTVIFPEDKPVLVTVIRVHPVEWLGSEPAIRIGLLGCYKLIETTTTVQKTTEVVTTTTPIVDETTTTEEPSVETMKPETAVVTTTVSSSTSKSYTTEPTTTTVYEVDTTTQVVVKTTEQTEESTTTG